MDKPFFVMLRHPNGEYFLPLVDDNYENMQFSTEDEARTAAESSLFGSETGYKIFDFYRGI
jgi:hypothetical protein